MRLPSFGSSASKSIAMLGFPPRLPIELTGESRQSSFGPEFCGPNLPGASLARSPVLEEIGGVNPHRTHRHTKIIFTVGPATCTPEKLTTLIQEGADVCRLNMAHATHDWCRETTRNIQSACERAGRQIALMMDVKGPEIRTGFLEQPIHLQSGDMLELWTRTSMPPSDEVLRVDVNYRDMGNDLRVGDTILVDSGLLHLEVVAIDENRVTTRVLSGGELGSRRHINLPGVEVKLPSLTEKDHADVQLGVELGIDFFALSFVRNAEAVEELRTVLRQQHSPARIVAKIEDQAGLRNLDEIARTADAVMVARGDLGVEIPFEQLPLVQNQAVKTCLTHGKPVIIATHMLESMVNSPFPTRAEIIDIANAVRERTDCIMLSGETTTGKYPLECVRVMHRIIDATECLNTTELNRFVPLREPKAKLMRSAAVLAQELENGGILLFTRSGFTAEIAAALRPNGIPIYAFSDDPSVFRQMLLLWGIEPFFMNFREVEEESICDALEILKERNWCKPGDRLAVITTIHPKNRAIDVLQLRYVE